MKKNKWKKWLGNLLLLLLLLVGLALIFNEQIKDYFVKSTGESYSLKNVDRETIEKNQEKDAPFDFDAVESMSSEAVIRAQMSKADLLVIGGVAVPSVNINLPIFKGLSNEALLYGAGTLSPDQKMGEGNYALASHRANNPDLLFTPLERLNLGDKIYVTDLVNVYTYKATFKEKVDPTATELLNVEEDKELVTLITCGDMDAITRLVVQGELVEVTPIDDATDEMRNAFNVTARTF
ncbi:MULTISPECIES: class A sortase [unclassified Enterococcus]|uniref:class A sortase n=1 Tax=unclassified Enterococcus TaxID=2608891 RepID=UPI003D29B765